MQPPELSLDEIARRRDEAIRRALNTPPQPNPTKIRKPVKRDVLEADESADNATGKDR